ncbi:MAG TPA: DUF222 domain-containing protein [Trebonia sp.]|nr:DUF222 domain-containing protein [Trebonia sp.]
MGVRDYPGRVPVDDVPPPGTRGGADRRGTAQREKAKALRAAFVQDGPADTLAPGALLAALTEAAFADPARLGDNELVGALEAARRLQNRAYYLQTLAVADLARRRAAQYEEDKADGVPRNQRRAQFPDLELAAQLLTGRRHAQRLLDEATELATRLPRTLAGMASGVIDPMRASAIASATLCLSDADAGRVDEAVAPVSHEVRADTVARRAGALAMKLDPEAVRREKDDARRTRQRVEARREESGNASFSIREAETSLVMSVEAAINELAVRLRNGGAEGTLDSLRALAALDRLLDRDPLDRLIPLPPEPAGDDGFPGPPGDDARNSEDDDRYVGHAGGRPESPVDPPAGGQAKFPALINLIVPAATLLGWGTAPGQAGAWGLTDPQETCDIVQAASRHPATRWCLTVLNERGEAVAHACARGRHPWKPEPPDPPPAAGDPPGAGDRSSSGDRAVRMQEFLTGLGITPGALERIAQGTCDHRHAEPRYVPSRKLKHLIRARAQTCTAPGCGGQSVHADQDHVIPYPGGPTDECNLHAPCRAHHRAKQSPDWQAEQPGPGVLRWTLPSGRTRTTGPTVYDC